MTIGRKTKGIIFSFSAMATGASAKKMSLLSSNIPLCFGRSANRGECAQFCRMKFVK